MWLMRLWLSKNNVRISLTICIMVIFACQAIQLCIKRSFICIIANKEDWGPLQVFLIIDKHNAHMTSIKLLSVTKSKRRILRILWKVNVYSLYTFIHPLRILVILKYNTLCLASVGIRRVRYRGKGFSLRKYQFYMNYKF